MPGWERWRVTPIDLGSKGVARTRRPAPRALPLAGCPRWARVATGCALSVSARPASWVSPIAAWAASCASAWSAAGAAARATWTAAWALGTCARDSLGEDALGRDAQGDAQGREAQGEDAQGDAQGRGAQEEDAQGDAGASRASAAVETCDMCHHPRVPGRGCLFCVGKSFCPAAARCHHCVARSVASDPRAREMYHVGNPRPATEVAGSLNDTAVQWHCRACSHDWAAAPFSVAAGTGCPFCAGRRLCDAADHCAACLARSVAGDARAHALYHPDNPWPASEVARHSSDRGIKWRCHACSHDWAAAPKRVATSRPARAPSPDGQRRVAPDGGGAAPGPVGCPYCAGATLCRAAAGCQTCLAKSVAGDVRARGLFHRGNPRPAAEVARSSGVRMLWWCATCTRAWRARPTDVTAGGGCPVCVASAAERAVARYLDGACVPFERERRFAWCRDRRELPFDFCLDCACVLEVDGMQHFVQWGARHDLEYTRRHDALKMRLALGHGLSVVRVLARVVRADGPEADWRDYLHRAINLARRRHARRAPPVVVLPRCAQYCEWWASGIGADAGSDPVYI